MTEAGRPECRPIRTRRPLHAPSLLASNDGMVTGMDDCLKVGLGRISWWFLLKCVNCDARHIFFFKSIQNLSAWRQHQDVVRWQLAIRTAATLPVSQTQLHKQLGCLSHCDHTCVSRQKATASQVSWKAIWKASPSVVTCNKYKFKSFKFHKIPFALQSGANYHINSHNFH